MSRLKKPLPSNLVILCSRVDLDLVQAKCLDAEGSLVAFIDLEKVGIWHGGGRWNPVFIGERLKMQRLLTFYVTLTWALLFFRVCLRLGFLLSTFFSLKFFQDDFFEFLESCNFGNFFLLTPELSEQLFEL